MRVVIVDGVMQSDGRCTIDVGDPGLTLGWTSFETMRTYGGALLALADHLDRLAASARAMHITLPPRPTLEEETERAIAPFAADCRVRITLTRGGLRIVQAQTLQPSPTGVHCATRVWEPPPWLPGEIKHGSRAASALAVIEAEVDEVLWVSREGTYLEGTHSNIFAVQGGVMRTPALDGRLLAGVTRGLLLKAARQAGMEVDEGSVLRAESVDELYVTSTLKELCPVLSLDGTPGPGGGPVGDLLRAVFQRFVEREVSR